MAADARVPAGSRELDRLFRQGTLLGRTEAELLDHFVRSRDEYAFEALVTRHGPMVLRTCRALLPDLHDADDAFQATFLVLSRRAGSIRNAELLGPWLHRVARRVCSRSLTRSSRRSRLERPSTDALATHAAPCATLPHADRAAIHEAIDRLPEAYRRVIILCDLEGHSHAEAASRLSCPIGTVKGRQSRARALLRRRLARLGLAPASLVSGSLFTLPARAFSVPHTLIHRTSRTASAFALGGTLAPGTVPGGALSLATGVLTGMAAHQLKLTALVGLLALGLGSSGLAALRHATDDGPRSANAPPVLGGSAPDAPKDLPDVIRSLIGAWEFVSINDHPITEGTSRLEVAFVERVQGGSKVVLSGKSTFIPFELVDGDRRVTAKNARWDHHVVVDPDATPLTWDYCSFEPESASGPISEDSLLIANRGICRLDEETLTLHVASANSARPDDFDSGESSTTRMVLTRLRSESPRRSRPDAGGVDGIAPTRAEDAEGVRSDDRARPTPVNPADDSVGGLVGTWKLVSRDGGPAFPRDLRLSVSRVEMTDPRAESLIRCQWTWYEKSSEPGEYVSLSALSLVNPDASPPSWDFYRAGVIHSGIGLSNRGIYRLDGDTLTLRFGKAGDRPRPDDFDGPYTTIYTRVVDEGMPESVPTPADDAADNRPDDQLQNDPFASVEPDPLSVITGSWRLTAVNGSREVGTARLNIKVLDRIAGEAKGFLLCTETTNLQAMHEEVRHRNNLQEEEIRHFNAVVDPTTDPPSWDYLTSDPDARNNPLRAIYRVEGDELTILSNSDGPRPSGFDQDGSFLRVVYERIRETFTDPGVGVIDVPPDGVPGVVPTTADDYRSDNVESRDDTADMADLLGTWTRVVASGFSGDDEIPLTLELAPVLPGTDQPFGPNGNRLLVTSLAINPDSTISTRRKCLAFLSMSANPDRIDFIPLGRAPQGPDPLIDSLGIVRVEGDLMTLHLSRTGGEHPHPRPTGFDRTDDQESVLLIFRRAGGGASGVGVPGVDPPPAEDAEGDRPDDPGRDDPGGSADRITPLLGLWRHETSDGKPVPIQGTAYMRLRRANLGLDAAIRDGATPLLLSSIVTSDLHPGMATSVERIAIVTPDPEGGHFDTVSVDAPAPGTENYRGMLGIYRLEGDLLTIRASGRGDRPAGFEPQDHGIIYIYRRVPLDELPAPIPEEGEDAGEAALVLTPGQGTDAPGQDDPSPLAEGKPSSIEHRLSTLEAKLDRLLELLGSPDR